MDDHEQPKRVVARSYDAIAERHAEWAAGIRQDERARFAQILIGACPAGAELLELGCGTAGPTTQTLAHHFRLTGVDISPRSIELAGRTPPNAVFIAADMTTVAFQANSFDAVAAFYSIIHVPRDELGSLFRRISAWLRPGGLFVATMMEAIRPEASRTIGSAPPCSGAAMIPARHDVSSKQPGLPSKPLRWKPPMKMASRLHSGGWLPGVRARGLPNEAIS